MTYQPFDPAPHTPSVVLPKGTVDTHMHVFGPQTKYPYYEPRTYTPTDALLADYKRMAKTVGIDRTVVVQPSVYGTDNRATRDAIRALGANGRGVAVVDPAVADDYLHQMHEDGFRGVRLNLLFAGGVDFPAVQSLANKLADMGWHIQFLINIAEFEGFYKYLSALPTDVVIDHIGHVPAAEGLEQKSFQNLLRLVDTGKCWVKLSGPYRITSEQYPPYADVTPFARALVKANPDRMVWGTDWPHPHIPVPMPNDGKLVDAVGNWIDDDTTLRKIMVANPEKLYGFEPFQK